VTWNMGEIAASRAPGALELFRKIMIASTSVPGAVSPVMINVEADGKTYQEMHVDGGVISQVFLYPATLMTELQREIGKPYQRELHFYVIRNGLLQPDWSNTKRRTLDIGGLAIGTLIQTEVVNDVSRLYQLAMQDGADFNLAFIGADFSYPHAEDFDTAYMNSLYEYAYQLGKNGRAWHKTLPSEVREH
jgi:hypothetical protein